MAKIGFWSRGFGKWRGALRDGWGWFVFGGLVGAAVGLGLWRVKWGGGQGLCASGGR